MWRKTVSGVSTELRMINARKGHPLHSFAALFSLQRLQAYTHTLTTGKHKPVCRGGSSVCVCVRPHRRGRLRSRPALAVVHTCLVRSGPVCVLIAVGVDVKAARDASRGRCYCYPTTTKARACGRRPVSKGEWPSRFSAQPFPPRRWLRRQSQSPVNRPALAELTGVLWNKHMDC